MPTINVQLFEGRSVEQKRAFVEAVTEATCRSLGCAPGSVDITVLPSARKASMTASGPPSTLPSDRYDEWMQTAARLIPFCCKTVLICSSFRGIVPSVPRFYLPSA